MAARTLRVGHSPDPDDAFMFFALLKGHVTLDGFAFADVVEPIEDLNRRALRGELEVTALSAHAFALAGGRYRLLSCGASVGRGYGPLLVATKPAAPEAFREATLGIPGELTTAALVTRMAFPKAKLVSVRFDEMADAVARGAVDAGVIIHEGQLTYAAQGLVRILDYGRWWADQTQGLPLPLGLDAVRADLGDEAAAAMNGALKASIAWAFAHPEEAYEYARGFGRGIDPQVNRRFVGMYVNQDTRELPPDGVRALEELFARAAALGIIPAAPAVRLAG